MGRSMKAQMKQANRLAAKYVLILGEDEVARGCAVLRNMSTSEQTEIPIQDITSILKQRCKVMSDSLKRSHSCGLLTKEAAGEQVVLCGWVAKRRDHGGLIFVDLRDRSGIVQIVVDPDDAGNSFTTAEAIRSEYVIKVAGKVRLRDAATVNPNLATGEIEVVAADLEVLNAAKTPPFYIQDDIDTDENLRLKYRYLDLRRPEMQKNLILRHKVTKLMRDYMDKNGFCEIETPMLTKSTPEGARDYLVPSRVNPGKFYALPQSPQIFKQILMVAGMERYFQIARCFRDEDLRADRQPEFTQLDIEMSFVDAEDIMEMMEGLMAYVFEGAMGKRSSCRCSV